MENVSSSDRRIPMPWSTAVEPPWSTATRPLSDIRELTEPSLLDISNYNAGLRHRSSLSRKGSLVRKTSLTRKASITRKTSISRKGSTKGIDKNTIKPLVGELAEQDIAGKQFSSSPASHVGASSSGVLASRLLLHHAVGVTDERSPQWQPSNAPLAAVPPRGQGYTITNHGRARSPIKAIVSQLEAPSDPPRRVPSRTFHRPNDYSNVDILDFPCHRHPRLSVDLQLNASLFVGGGTVEGQVRFCVEDVERVRHRRQLGLGRISVDLLGVEELSTSRRHVFLNFATELIDVGNPPPLGMVETQKQPSPIDPFWALVPSLSHLPFALSLPLDVGPPPFQSKIARIRYVIAVTALIKDQGKQYLVRSSQEVVVLPVYDPEKALVSLPSPLTASDDYIRHGTAGPETIKVLAGLHRQVWVSGTCIFVDLHINNESKKTIKRIELQLERDILCYKHAAASTMERSASQARIFDSNERATLTKATFKSGQNGWPGVGAYSSDIHTFDLELPRGHATVRCGKYFEVRYFLNIMVSSSHTRLVTVQLPIVLIHMNSLDVVPNSVAQVAAAIEKKRSQRHGSGSGRSPSKSRRRSISTTSVQGRAFAAPRKQSFDKARTELEELSVLRQVLIASPRKYAATPQRDHSQPPRTLKQQSTPNIRHAGAHSKPQGPPSVQQSPARSFFNHSYNTPPSHRKGRVLSDELGSEVRDIRDRLRRMRSNETNRSATRTGAPPPPPKDHGPASASKVFNITTGWRDRHHEPEPSPLRGQVSRSNSALESRDQTRPFQFRKMRSVEKWMGSGGWFSGDGARERETREQEERQRMLANWI